MDRTELEHKLETFKQACIANGYINANNQNALIIEESYPGMKPTSFIVNVTASNHWLENKYSVTALKELTNVLYDKTDIETLENILTLRIVNKTERHFFDNLENGKSA
ncbi:MAG: hypothetical protein WAX77_08155 [Methylococcaceae bacterium]